MPYNQKGARAERELLHLFYDRGWAVIRSAGSGSNSISPDLVVAKDRDVFAFECKNQERNHLQITNEQFDTLLDWERRSKLILYVAWRMNKRGWHCLRLVQFHASMRGHAISKNTALAEGLALDAFLPPYRLK